MKTTIALLALCFFGISCSDHSAHERTNGYSETPVTKEDSLFQQVMNGHDAAMAKMGKLAGLRKQADRQIDSLRKHRSPDNDARISSLRDIAGKLKAAENNMNGWMEGFSIDSVKENKEKRIAYLESEKAKVYAVKDQLLLGVAEADSVLKRK